MDAVGLRRVAFLANSMGCQIVADLAVRYPERTDRLILVGPTLDPDAHTVRQQLPRLLRAGAAERASLPPLMIADYLRTRPRAKASGRSGGVLNFLRMSHEDSNRATARRRLFRPLVEPGPGMR